VLCRRRVCANDHKSTTYEIAAGYGLTPDLISRLDVTLDPAASEAKPKKEKPVNTETDWFPHTVKPVYEGVYKTRHFLTPQHRNAPDKGVPKVIQGFSRWDVTKQAWCFVQGTIKMADKQWTGSMQNKEWKGLVKP
jgi:hypothetical protein